MKLISILLEDDASLRWVPPGALTNVMAVTREQLLDTDQCNVDGIGLLHGFRRAIERGEGPAVGMITPTVTHAEGERRGLLCACPSAQTVYLDHRLGLVRCHACRRIYGPVRAGWLHRQWLRIWHALKPAPQPVTMLDIRQRLQKRGTA